MLPTRRRGATRWGRRALRTTTGPQTSPEEDRAVELDGPRPSSKFGPGTVRRGQRKPGRAPRRRRRPVRSDGHSGGGHQSISVPRPVRCRMELFGDRSEPGRLAVAGSNDHLHGGERLRVRPGRLHLSGDLGGDRLQEAATYFGHGRRVVQLDRHRYRSYYRAGTATVRGSVRALPRAVREYRAPIFPRFHATRRRPNRTLNLPDGPPSCLVGWLFGVERVTGIEPALSAWEADVLPLNYTRRSDDLSEAGRLASRDGAARLPGRRGRPGPPRRAALPPGGAATARPPRLGRGRGGLGAHGLRRGRRGAAHDRRAVARTSGTSPGPDRQSASTTGTQPGPSTQEAEAVTFPGPARHAAGTLRGAPSRPQGARADHPREPRPHAALQGPAQPLRRQRLLGAGDRPAVPPGRHRGHRRRGQRPRPRSEPPPADRPGGRPAGRARRAGPAGSPARSWPWSASASAAGRCGACSAAGEPRLAAAVPFYGPGAGEPRLLRLRGGGPRRLRRARQPGQRHARTPWMRPSPPAGLTHELRVFPGVDHAFFNDTGARYDPTQAAAAYAGHDRLVRPPPGVASPSIVTV